MKIFKSIPLLLVLLLPFHAQAGQSYLLDQLNGPWYSNDMTLVFDFERNQIFMNVGTHFGKLPLTIENEIANVLFFKISDGRLQSARYVSPDIMYYTINAVNETTTFYRWHYDGNILDKLDGAWVGSHGTAVFDFKNGDHKIISGVTVENHKLKEVIPFVNTVFYKLDDEDIQHSIHLIAPDILHICDERKSGKYGTLYRWHGNN